MGLGLGRGGNHVDFDRAFGRIATNYVKMGDLDQAINFFQRSLTEHRTPEILNKLRDVPPNPLEPFFPDSPSTPYTSLTCSAKNKKPNKKDSPTSTKVKPTKREKKETHYSNKAIFQVPSRHILRLSNVPPKMRGVMGIVLLRISNLLLSLRQSRYPHNP